MINSVPFDVTRVILIILVVIAAILTIRIVYSLTSKQYRETYAKKIRYCLGIGLVLGLILPWNETLGLTAALVSVSLFLLLALYSMLVMGEIGNIPLISQTWVPRENVRRLLSYFSIIEAVMGIVLILLSIILPFFTSYQISITIMPLAFASIAILSDLFDLTFPNPPYKELFSLLYLYYRKNKDKQTDDECFSIEDPQFHFVLENTEFNIYELREALELMVRDGMAERTVAATPMGRVRFKIYKMGIDAIKLEYKEKMLSLSTQKQRIARVLEYFNSEEIKKSLDTQKKVRKALKIIDQNEETARKFFKENKYYVKESWLYSTLCHINNQRKLLLSHQKSKNLRETNKKENEISL